MAVTRKIKTSDLNAAIENTLNDVVPRPINELLEPAATKPTPKPKAAEPSQAAGDTKKVLITAKINESTLKAWKQFCLDYDITLTDAIKRAMTHYIKDVQSGTIEI